jgi:simple sugar transport system permease protein
MLVGLLVNTILLATPVLYATLGEIVGQRSGLVNLGIEGIMLIGAATGYRVAVSGHAGAGLVAAAIAGCAANLLFGLLVVGRRTNQLATGLAFFFLGAGLSAIIGRAAVGRPIAGLDDLPLPGLATLPPPYVRLFRFDGLVWMAVPVAVLLWWALYRTRWGLRVRAVGEDRIAAFAAGVFPDRVQYQALAVAGLLSGLAGAHLALAFTKTWQEYMTAGRGFVAIVIVFFSLWHPIRALAGAALFGAAVAVGLQLQAQAAPVSPFVLDMLPYVLTLVVVLTWGRPRAFAVPAGLREVFEGTAK